LSILGTLAGGRPSLRVALRHTERRRTTLYRCLYLSFVPFRTLPTRNFLLRCGSAPQRRNTTLHARTAAPARTLRAVCAVAGRGSLRCQRTLLFWAYDNAYRLQNIRSPSQRPDGINWRMLNGVSGIQYQNINGVVVAGGGLAGSKLDGDAYPGQ